MTTQQQPQHNVPATLIEDLGTGEDVLGLLGKRIRITNVPAVDPLVEAIFGGCPYDKGAIGTVVHVTEDGNYWADFGDDENVRLQGPEGEQRRLWDFTSVDGPFGPEDDPVAYVVLGEADQKEAA